MGSREFENLNMDSFDFLVRGSDATLLLGRRFGTLLSELGMWNSWVKFQKIVGKNPQRFSWVCGKRLFWGKNGDFTSKIRVDWLKSEDQNLWGICGF